MKKEIFKNFGLKLRVNLLLLKFWYRVNRGKLSQWLYWAKNLLERSTGDILNLSMNANFFAFSTLGWHQLPWPEIEFYVIFHAK